MSSIVTAARSHDHKPCTARRIPSLGTQVLSMPIQASPRYLRVTYGQVRSDPTGLIARLKHLVHDLEHLANGAFPPGGAIARAPLLTGYVFGTWGVPCLIGAREGPIPFKGRFEDPSSLAPANAMGFAVIMTSEVMAFAPDAGWVGTPGQLYRLGEASNGWPVTNGSARPGGCADWPRREPGSR